MIKYNDDSTINPNIGENNKIDNGKLVKSKLFEFKKTKKVTLENNLNWNYVNKFL